VINGFCIIENCDNMLKRRGIDDTGTTKQAVIIIRREGQTIAFTGVFYSWQAVLASPAKIIIAFTCLSA